MNNNDDHKSDEPWTSAIAARARRARTRQWRVTAEEPEWELEASGPHVPSYSSAQPDANVPTASGNMRDDYGNIALLLLLYTLQGIPLGLSASIPMLLQSRQISYTQQAAFSFAFWPFSMKLLWAPIVDSVYWPRMGRRKSWLVPTQYLIGAFMLIFSFYVHEIIGDVDDHTPPNIMMLTCIFFPLNFLAATQDIAVDGWALTMLKSHNVGYASTTNAVGQTAGFFLGNAIFLALESAEFCNRYLRNEPKTYGVVTLADFVYFWGITFMVCTTLVLLFKRENDKKDVLTVDESTSTDDFEDMGVFDAYRLLWKIIRLPPVMSLIGVLLTMKMAFAAGDGLTGLKLIEAGVPKDKLALLAIPLTPLQIALPWILGRRTSGPRPMDVCQKAYPYKIVTCLMMSLVVWVTPAFKLSDGQFPVSFYLLCIFAYCLHQIASYSIFVGVMAFNAQISDPNVGGTYMTLLNTVTNLGGNWPVTLMLSLVDYVTWRQCSDDSACANDTECAATGGKCAVSFDGYYLLLVLCAIVGFVWWRVAYHKIYALQSLPKSQWSVNLPTSKSAAKLEKM